MMETLLDLVGQVIQTRTQWVEEFDCGEVAEEVLEEIKNELRLHPEKVEELGMRYAEVKHGEDHRFYLAYTMPLDGDVEWPSTVVPTFLGSSVPQEEELPL